MSDLIIHSSMLGKQYGETNALNGVDLSIHRGSVLGLIGPNGAGKTTLLRSLLGMCNYTGELEVLGKDPRTQRAALLEQVCTIPDTAVLPRWMTVKQLLDYVNGVHPRFNREQAETFLRQTEVTAKRKIAQLSKGMMVQLHLALVMSIDAQLLVLDEPTLGLDILFRKQFFEQLLNDYYDEERTIIISTHQVEEVEHILTDVMFMQSGRKVLHQSMETIANDYLELHTSGADSAEAETLPWLSQRSTLGGKAYIFEQASAEKLQTLGELTTPLLADLFIAIMSQENNE